jgi:hypothetical protein
VKKDKELVAKFLSTTVRTVEKIWKSAREQEEKVLKGEDTWARKIC